MSTALFEALMPKLIAIISLLSQTNNPTSVQSKQALVKAINDFKETLNQAKHYASDLPGGDLTSQEQDNIIAMLETMKRTQRTLLQASLQDISSSPTTGPGEMEVDSTASTPVGN
ncbi:hypothetical protein QCA50_001334 [Cerrena zonata]|uniref:Mediator of RNA polymerase II transcription subunit 9 n=1 Tax=Cerrena zonata TaxID=2478898 RepID=A0AAW0GQP6_9APHY